MGLSQSLWTGLSGLKSHQAWTDVIGNNLTNTNTEGFKYSAVSFSDIFYNMAQPGSAEDGGSGSTNSMQIGNGVNVASIDVVFTQGNLQETDRTFDCALEGQGFFVFGDLGGSAGSENPNRYYSRNGSFYLGAPDEGALEQPLLSHEGLSVYGYNATDGVLGSTLESLILPSQGTTMPGLATSNIDWSGNINSGDPVVEGNSVQTVQESTSGSVGWISANGSEINIGGVETTPYLYDDSATTSTSAMGSTDLINLAYERGSGTQSLFTEVPAGFTADSRTIDVEYKKGGQTYTATFTYGVDGTTLEDLSEWLTGGFGDDGTPDTQRLEGGAMGTLRTREYTVDGDGFDAPAEQAGGYLRQDDTGTQFSIASNLGAQNAISDIILTCKTHMVNASTGEERNTQNYLSDFFDEDRHYQVDELGGSATTSVDVYTADASVEGGVVEEQRSMTFTLISRDSEGSTWRWMMDGQELDGTDLSKGTGIVRFGIDPQAETQVIASTVDGGCPYTLDFDSMTQMASADNINSVPDGYDTGELDTYTIDQYGVISGVFTNGLTEVLGKMATALIPNEEGLISIGGTMFTDSNVSGEPIFNTAENELGWATVRSKYLEASNVDSAREMSNLILSQRGYQISSTIVTTSDEMLKTAYQMKS